MKQIRLFTYLLSASLFGTACFGSDRACDLLATKAIEAQIDVLHLSDERDASHRDNTVHAGRAAERLVYIAATCPKQFFTTVQGSQPTKWFSAWRTALRDDSTLQPRERQSLIAAAKRAASLEGKHGQQTAELLNSVSAIPSHTLAVQCGATFRHVLIGLSDDWMARSGALWFDYSDSILLMLASCPEDSYYVFDQRPEVLSSWLRELPKASFWGDPKVIHQLQELQKSLVELLQQQQAPEYLRDTRNEILNRLRTLCVTAVDEETPCEAYEGESTLRR